MKEASGRTTGKEMRSIAKRKLLPKSLSQLRTTEALILIQKLEINFHMIVVAKAISEIVIILMYEELSRIK